MKIIEEIKRKTENPLMLIAKEYAADMLVKALTEENLTEEHLETLADFAYRSMNQCHEVAIKKN